MFTSIAQNWFAAPAHPAAANYLRGQVEGSSQVKRELTGIDPSPPGL